MAKSSTVIPITGSDGFGPDQYPAGVEITPDIKLKGGVLFCCLYVVILCVGHWRCCSVCCLCFEFCVRFAFALCFGDLCDSHALLQEPLVHSPFSVIASVPTLWGLYALLCAACCF